MNLSTVLIKSRIVKNYAKMREASTSLYSKFSLSSFTLAAANLVQLMMLRLAHLLISTVGPFYPTFNLSCSRM